MPDSPLVFDEWTEIGKRCSRGRRSLWMRLVFGAGVEAIELRAGREGDDVFVKITRENPQFQELLDLFTTARFAATT